MRLIWFLLITTPALAREWTRESGTAMKFQAELRGVDGPNVLLQAPDGRPAGFPLAQFSDEDQRYVAARLPGLVLDAMTPPNVGQKAGAGWGRLGQATFRRSGRLRRQRNGRWLSLEALRLQNERETAADHAARSRRGLRGHS